MSTSSSVPMVAPNTGVAVLSATQIATVMSTLDPLVKDQSLNQILVNMPVIVETTYSFVQTCLAANEAQVSATVVTLIQGALGLSPLPAADVTILDAVVANIVPSMVALVAKYLPEVEEEVESGCTACCKWLEGLVCWHTS